MPACRVLPEEVPITRETSGAGVMHGAFEGVRDSGPQSLFARGWGDLFDLDTRHDGELGQMCSAARHELRCQVEGDLCTDLDAPVLLPQLGQQVAARVLEAWGVGGSPPALGIRAVDNGASPVGHTEPHGHGRGQVCQRELVAILI